MKLPILHCRHADLGLPRRNPSDPHPKSPGALAAKPVGADAVSWLSVFAPTSWPRRAAPGVPARSTVMVAWATAPAPLPANAAPPRVSADTERVQRAAPPDWHECSSMPRTLSNGTGPTWHYEMATDARAAVN
jgi:hypothetical protein